MIWFPKHIIFQIKDFGNLIKPIELQKFINGILLMDLVEFCNMPGTYTSKATPSKGDFRRLIKQNGLRINNKVVTDLEYIVTFEDFDDDSDFIWITRGKKVKHESFIILTEAPVTGEELVWHTNGTWY